MGAIVILDDFTYLPSSEPFVHDFRGDSLFCGPYTEELTRCLQGELNSPHLEKLMEKSLRCQRQPVVFLIPNNKIVSRIHIARTPKSVGKTMPMHQSREALFICRLKSP
jgi:hypothetical protein